MSALDNSLALEDEEGEENSLFDQIEDQQTFESERDDQMKSREELASEIVELKRKLTNAKAALEKSKLFEDEQANWIETLLQPSCKQIEELNQMLASAKADHQTFESEKAFLLQKCADSEYELSAEIEERGKD